MRVVSRPTRRHACTVADGSAPTAARAANIELLGLVFCSAVVVLGPVADDAGADWRSSTKTTARSDRVIDLRTLHDPSELAPLLTMFESPAERQAAATPLFRRAVGDAPALDHVGGLADVTLPAADVRAQSALRAAARAARAPACRDARSRS